MMRLFQLWLADIRAKREYEELYNDARDDAAHWRGAAKQLAEAVLDPDDFSQFEKAERILKELEEKK